MIEWLVQLGCVWAVFLAFAFIDLPTILDRAIALLRQHYAPPTNEVDR